MFVFNCIWCRISSYSLNIFILVNLLCPFTEKASWGYFFLLIIFFPFGLREEQNFGFWEANVMASCILLVSELFPLLVNKCLCWNQDSKFWYLVLHLELERFSFYIRNGGGFSLPSFWCFTMDLTDKLLSWLIWFIMENKLDSNWIDFCSSSVPSTLKILLMEMVVAILGQVSSLNL